jgi:hypothetical protein
MWQAVYLPPRDTRTRIACLGLWQGSSFKSRAKAAGLSPASQPGHPLGPFSFHNLFEPDAKLQCHLSNNIRHLKHRLSTKTGLRTCIKLKTRSRLSRSI